MFVAELYTDDSPLSYYSAASSVTTLWEMVMLYLEITNRVKVGMRKREDSGRGRGVRREEDVGENSLILPKIPKFWDHTQHLPYL
jgi:hypothetical protein